MSTKGGKAAPQHSRPDKPAFLYIWDDVAYWIGIVLSKGIPWVGIVYVVREGRLALEALAGRHTDANIFLKFMAEVRADQSPTFSVQAELVTLRLNMSSARKRSAVWGNDSRNLKKWLILGAHRALNPINSINEA